MIATGQNGWPVRQHGSDKLHTWVIPGAYRHLSRSGSATAPRASARPLLRSGLLRPSSRSPAGSTRRWEATLSARARADDRLQQP